jgi:hypothetical protein
VRNGAIHILDYKPDARTNKPIAQLSIYALALTRLVPGLKLFDIKCAWLNERAYNEFFPRLLLPRPTKSGTAKNYEFAREAIVNWSVVSQESSAMTHFSLNVVTHHAEAIQPDQALQGRGLRSRFPQFHRG